MSLCEVEAQDRRGNAPDGRNVQETSARSLHRIFPPRLLGQKSLARKSTWDGSQRSIPSGESCQVGIAEPLSVLAPADRPKNSLSNLGQNVGNAR